MSHHHEDTKPLTFDKADIGTKEMVYVWLFGLAAAGSVMFSYLYFSSIEGFSAPPFMLAMLVGIGVAAILNVINMIVRSLFSIDD
ncbi:MAG: hypothetical protein IBX71_03900 [Candidatus Desulforudis sp.]|nr:hypothetical protein [Desulforudis sp.]